MAYMIMEDEKSHNLLSAHWRTRRRQWCNSVQVQWLENQGADGAESWSESESLRMRRANVKGQKMAVSAQKEQICLFYDFCSIQDLNGFDDTHSYW